MVICDDEVRWLHKVKRMHIAKRNTVSFPLRFRTTSAGVRFSPTLVLFELHRPFHFRFPLHVLS